MGAYGQGDWVVPPNRAVWVPAGVEHGIEMTGRVLVQTIYLAADISGELPRQCCAVNVSPLLRELIVHTVTLGNAGPEHPFAGPADRIPDGSTERVARDSPAASFAHGRTCEARSRMAAGAPRGPGLIRTVARQVAVKRPDARAALSARNRHDIRQVAAAASAASSHADCWRPGGRSPLWRSKSATTARVPSSRCSNAPWERRRIVISRPPQNRPARADPDHAPAPERVRYDQVNFRLDTDALNHLGRDSILRRVCFSTRSEARANDWHVS